MLTCNGVGLSYEWRCDEKASIWHPFVSMRIRYVIDEKFWNTSQSLREGLYSRANLLAWLYGRVKINTILPVT